MTERTVNLGMCTYTDVNGARRIGQLGEVVNVHPNDLARFAEVNGIIEVEINEDTSTEQSTAEAGTETGGTEAQVTRPTITLGLGRPWVCRTKEPCSRPLGGGQAFGATYFHPASAVILCRCCA